MTPQLIMMLVNTGLTIFIGIISFFLKRTLDNSEANSKRLSDKIDLQTTMIHGLETSLSNKDTRIVELEKKIETAFDLINRSIEKIHNLELKLQGCKGKYCEN